METKCLTRVFTILITLTILSSCVQKGEQKVENPQQEKSLHNGKLLYKQYCIACHQADGGGVPKINPPLAKTTYVTGDKKQLAKILLNGMNESIEINGKFYSNRMPSFSYLSDSEIADILSFIRNNFGNKSGFIEASEIGKIRKSNTNF